VTHAFNHILDKKARFNMVKLSIVLILLPSDSQLVSYTLFTAKSYSLAQVRFV
jgi:hypothetical protein